MPWYNVTISRTETSTADFEVEASNEEAAEGVAMELAGNHPYDHSEGEYEVEEVVEIE